MCQSIQSVSLQVVPKAHFRSLCNPREKGWTHQSPPLVHGTDLLRSGEEESGTGGGIYSHLRMIQLPQPSTLHEEWENLDAQHDHGVGRGQK